MVRQATFFMKLTASLNMFKNRWGGGGGPGGGRGGGLTTSIHLNAISRYSILDVMM